MQNNDISEALQSRIQNAIEANRTLTIRGGGSKAFYGNSVTCDEALGLSAHQGIVAYEPSELAITVRAGTPLSELEKLLAENGQMIPFDPPDFDGSATIGGAIATGLSGPRRPYTGSVRDALLGVKTINGKGEILEFGGRVMKNVAGYDLSRLMSGAMGTLGVLLEVSFKLRPRPASEKTLVTETDLDSALQQMRNWHRNPANFSASAFDGKRLYLRVCGDPQTVDNTVSTTIIADNKPELLDDHETFWRDLKNHHLSWFQTDAPIWRLSLKPSVPTLALPGNTLLEWAGGIRWLRSNRPAVEIRETVAKHGGHATLFHCGDVSQAENTERFHPLDATVFQLHKNLKKSLDPKGIFNPGRLYSSL